MSVGVVILAAGKGTRMKTDTAKVLHEACGRTLLGWAFASLDLVDADEISVVVGHQAEDVGATCPDGVAVVVQEPQNGTGHATEVGLAGLDITERPILVLPGDMPLLRDSTIKALVDDHERSGAAVTLLSVELDDPTGYGRVVREGDGVAAIVEHRDATPEQLTINEVNTSVYVFDGSLLAGALGRITDDNSQGERYLTDVVGILAGEGHTVRAVTADVEEGAGVNSQLQLAEAAAVLRSRINASLCDSGVWMLDPSRVYVDAGVSVEPGARLFPDTYLSGSTSVASGAQIGPNAQITDSVVDADAHVYQSVAIGSSIGTEAVVGPFAYLRPGAVLGPRSKIGAHVEIKGSTIGEGSKVPHLSYVGDAIIGAGSNLGAGTITVNYDGFAKHKTIIGDNVRIGSDTMLVAPVEVGDNAFTGAGSVITNDVPEGALAVERTTQKNVEGYADKRRKRSEGKPG
ncbi:MAG: bifunctional UDP-N-acetylglucosamine diphosphorylase/glucosamine-1-phosphate N-acetyltransferase GlmU [Acidimicrobiia bacterium]